MKNILSAIAVCFVLSAVPAYAHHMAADIVDEEVYAMIDELVSDTPHAELVLDGDMGSVDDHGDVITEETIDELSINVPKVRDIEEMMEDGLLTYVSKLDGLVSITIDFNDDQSVTMTIIQVEE